MARYQFGGSPADIVFLPVTEDGILRVAANAVVTAWDSETGGVQITDLSLSFDGSNVQTLTSNGSGRLPRFYGPDAVTELWVDTGDANDRYLLVTSELGSLINNKVDKSATPTPVSISTVTGLQRELDRRPILVKADTSGATPVWPSQPDVTATYPPIPMFWDGPATIPSQARLGDHIDQHGNGSTIIPTPTPTPTPTPNPVTGISLGTTVGSASGAQLNVTGTMTLTTTAKSFAYALVAVRGPNGANYDQDRRQNVTYQPGAVAFNANLTAPSTGNYTHWLSYVLQGSDPDLQPSWIDGPKTTTMVTVPSGGGGGGGAPITTPTGRQVPFIGRSGLNWNSGCFTHDQWDQSSTNAFGTYRGRLIDSRLVFAPHDGANWTGNNGMLEIPDEWVGFPGITVISIGPQPQPQNNSSTAAGNNNSRFETYGQLINAKGMNNNRTIIRLGWECNGGWYAWSWDKPNAASYVAAFKNVVTSVRRYAPNVLFDFNVNKDFESLGGKTWREVADDLHGYIDILSLDAYDMYNGWRNDTGRMNEWLNKSGPQRNTVVQYARANSIPLGFPEWALVALAGGDGTGGGDDVLFMQKTKEFFVGLAAEGLLAYEHYYNDAGAPDTLLHELYRYPNSETYYRSTAGWGNH